MSVMNRIILYCFHVKRICYSHTLTVCMKATEPYMLLTNIQHGVKPSFPIPVLFLHIDKQVIVHVSAEQDNTILFTCQDDLLYSYPYCMYTRGL